MPRTRPSYHYTIRLDYVTTIPSDSSMLLDMLPLYHHTAIPSDYTMLPLYYPTRQYHTILSFETLNHCQ